MTDLTFLTGGGGGGGGGGGKGGAGGIASKAKFVESAGTGACCSISTGGNGGGGGGISLLDWAINCPAITETKRVIIVFFIHRFFMKMHPGN
ncbi:MAG: hypothetical protein WKI04_06565 [Ferruginibacter sp.]